jgi:hypothetical protein
VTLLKELRSLNDQDFKAAIDDAIAPPASPKKQQSAKKPTKPRKDSPVFRVAQTLREARGLADHEAKVWLQAALQRDGIDPRRIPPVSNAPLEVWLELLFQTVRSADALAVAKSG